MTRDRWCSVVWATPSDAPVWSGRCAPVVGSAVLAGLSVVTSSRVGGTHRVVAAGELNLMTVPLLDGAMGQAAPSRPVWIGVLLDLAGVTFLDVAGLAALQRADTLTQQRGLDLTVAPPSAPGPGLMLHYAVGSGFLRPVFDGQGTGRA